MSFCVIGWTALHEASVGGYYQTVNALLESGADVNVKGMYQITPLHDAVMNGHYQVLNASGYRISTQQESKLHFQFIC